MTQTESMPVLLRPPSPLRVAAAQAAGIIALVVSFIAGLLLPDAPSTIVFHWFAPLIDSIDAVYVADWLGAVLIGLLIVLAQWLVIRRWISRTWLWLLAGALAL